MHGGASHTGARARATHPLDRTDTADQSSHRARNLLRNHVLAVPAGRGGPPTTLRERYAARAALTFTKQPHRCSLLKSLHTALQLVRATRGHHVILSSDADRRQELRSPHDVINLSHLFGLGHGGKGQKALDTNPSAVVRYSPSPACRPCSHACPFVSAPVPFCSRPRLCERCTRAVGHVSIDWRGNDEESIPQLQGWCRSTRSLRTKCGPVQNLLRQMRMLVRAREEGAIRWMLI